MREALEIMRRLLDGEKLTFDGDWYRTDRAKLYSPPVSNVPIWMAAGGPKSAALAATMADGIITSVRDPQTTKERVIDPAIEAATSAGRTIPTIAASRWTIRADSAGDAWMALGAWRGLRAPGRLEAVDPADLRKRADDLDRDEVLAAYSLVSEPTDYVAVYRPLVTDIGADIVTIQTTSLDQEATIAMLGASVLPELRALAS
jgi:alkanesulfonate monooxygenase SsuD/methylene tetrahydromethanopterin reductase-like flavin-dependent oxidoreductase (luciferase family)